MRSISDNNSQRLTKLLRYGAGLRITQEDLSTALISAIKQSRTECVDSILKAGCDANTADEEGRPAIYVLMEHGRGNPEILKSLIRSGANPNKVTWSTQQTGLHAAARKGYQVCIKQLLLAGVNVARQDSNGYTALMYAAREGHITILRALLSERTDPNIVNNNHETALHLAVKYHHATCVDQLLCQHADPCIVDNKGQNPLLLAFKDGDQEMIDLLLENSGAVNAQDKTTGKTVLHLAIEIGNLPLIMKLLHKGADPNVRDKEWQTPFLIALNTGRRDIMEHLLRAGCKITATDRSFNTPLHIASLNGQADMIHLFIERGLDVNLKGSGGMTPIMLASLGAHTKTIQILLQYGAKCSLTDRNHASALVYAILSKAHKRQIYDTVKVLIKANCDVNQAANLNKIQRTFQIEFEEGIEIDTKRLYSPLEIAFLRADSPLFMMLVYAGADISTFHCDKDTTLQNYQSVQADLKSRWLLLRCLKKERKRVKSLKELCRRPLLKSFKHNVGMTVNSLPISEQLKSFLKFSDVDEICEEFTNETENIQSPKSPKTHMTSPFSRGTRYRSTIHLASHSRHKSASNEPTTPTLPRASWDYEKKDVPILKTPKKARAHSITSPGMSASDRRRIAAAAAPGLQDQPHSPLTSPIHSPIDEEEVDNQPKIGFFNLMRSKAKSSKHHDPKARSKRARDPRETINMLLHGSNEEYTSSGEITPRPLDMASIEALNEIDKSPQEDHASVNKMLYGKSLSTNSDNGKADSGKTDIAQRIRNMRKETMKKIDKAGVESYINGTNNVNNNGLFSEVSDFNAKMEALTNGDIELERKVKRKVSFDDSYKTSSTFDPPKFYPNGEPISPHASPVFNRKPLKVNDNYPTTRKLTRSSSMREKGGYSRNYNNTPAKSNFVNNNVKPRGRLSTTDMQVFDDKETELMTPPPVQNGFIYANTRTRNLRPPSLDISQADSSNSPSLLSPPTSNTDSLDSGSGSHADYKFPTGDAQLMQKYLTSQDSGISTNMESLNIKSDRNGGIYIHDLNGNASQSNPTTPHRQSNRSRQNMNSEPRVRTSSVSSVGSTGSRMSQGSRISQGSSKRGQSKIPVFQGAWTPSPAPKSKLPVPVTSPYGASSRGFGNFVRSKSVRKW